MLLHVTDLDITVQFVLQRNSTNHKEKTGVQEAAAEATSFQKYTNASGFAAFLHQRLGQLLSTAQVSPALQPLHFFMHHLCGCVVG
jgi:hypothetical protein